MPDDQVWSQLVRRIQRRTDTVGILAADELCAYHDRYDYFDLPFWASMLCNFLDDRHDDRLIKAKL